jgi:hypothetical protein
MADLFLGQAKFTVSSLNLLTNCPKFENLKLLPYRVQSAVKEDSFQVCVSALGGMELAITTTNMDDLHLLCDEFGFTGLLTQVSNFISAHSAAEDEARKGVTDIAEENLQIKGALFPLQEALAGLRTGNAQLVRTTELFQQSLC